ncbi:glycerol-3-phosphate transporter [Platysternon megacephalum]|uniref:Glycerol-3-phosphate transporter n=1 Tax=Platysternon megacephalum TaxID=55544 RepID=A0A4D9E867_9SAUR|nr:glycerol-3-phosphate transporter [Platysternon megacephalum]
MEKHKNQQEKTLFKKSRAPHPHCLQERPSWEALGLQSIALPFAQMFTPVQKHFRFTPTLCAGVNDSSRESESSRDYYASKDALVPQDRAEETHGYSRTHA